MTDSSRERPADWGDVLCDSLLDSVFLLDGDGRIVFVNERLCEATGRTRQELTGTLYTTLDAFVRDDSFPAFAEAIEAVARGDAAERRAELEVTSPVEGDVVVEARITSALVAEGDGHVVVVLRDLTEKVEQARALAVKSEQLAVVNRVLRHDVRDDVSVVLGWGEELETRLTDEENAAILDRMLRHSRQVLELTHAAHYLVEAIEDEWRMACRATDVGATLSREVETARERFPDADFAVSESLDLPPVEANEFLGSVFSNLLSNAVWHNDSDVPHVVVRAETTGDTVTVTVADDGPGVPDAQKAAMFEMGNAGPASSGTGLGLYLIHSLVTAYGGSVTIADNAPRGTVVTVELRRVDAGEAHADGTDAVAISADRQN